MAQCTPRLTFGEAITAAHKRGQIPGSPVQPELSDEHKNVILRAADDVVDKFDGKRIPRLRRKNSREAGTWFEDAMRTALRKLDPTAAAPASGNGVDFAGVKLDVKSSCSHIPQSGSHPACSCARALGNDHHLLMFPYELDRSGRVRFGKPIVIEASYTADYVVSSAAEHLRQAVLAGEMGVVDAMIILRDDFRLDWCPHLTERLQSDDPIRMGRLTVSRVDGQRVDYRHVHGQAVTIGGTEAFVAGQIGTDTVNSKVTKTLKDLTDRRGRRGCTRIVVAAAIALACLVTLGALSSCGASSTTDGTPVMSETASTIR
jgi:hypothetical protein